VHAGFEHSGLNQGRIGGQGAGLLNAFQAAGDDRLLPASMPAILLASFLLVRSFQLVKAGIFQQQATGHRCKQILTADAEEERVILFKQVFELIVEPGTQIDGVAALTCQELQLAGQGIFGLET